MALLKTMVRIFNAQRLRHQPMAQPTSGDIPSLPSPPSELEAKSYYYGLPSVPVLVARTGPTPVYVPTSPEAHRKPKDLRPIGKHAPKFQEAWQDDLPLKLFALLDSLKVKWTSTDVVRIGYVDDSFPPVVLWIGVMPASLSREDGVVVVSKCLELLRENDITDVEVEIRESVVIRSAGPKLLKPTLRSDPTFVVREPLTTTLGLPICAHSTPWIEGTGGFFITESENTKRLLLVTARHVVFPWTEHDNGRFVHRDDSQRRVNVRLGGDAAFKSLIGSIQASRGAQIYTTDYQEGQLAKANKQDGPQWDKKREEAQTVLRQAMEAADQLNSFSKDVSTNWAPPDNRIIGHVILSPPIDVGIGDECYTEDWAVIEIDASKIDASNFQGNVIDLGADIPPERFFRMLCPYLTNVQPFKYPSDRLLRLKGIISDEDMRHPISCDQKNNPCLIVMKRSSFTDLTFGCANNIYSYARGGFYYDDHDGNAKISKEWAILPFDSRPEPFSDKGDSGSVVVDVRGRIGGLLTGGCGTTNCLHISYATPISFLLRRMEDEGLYKPNINPVLTA